MHSVIDNSDGMHFLIIGFLNKKGGNMKNERSKKKESKKEMSHHLEEDFNEFEHEPLYDSYKEAIDDNLEFNLDYRAYKCKMTGKVFYDKRDCLNCGECIKLEGSKKAKKQYNYILYCVYYRSRKVS